MSRWNSEESFPVGCTDAGKAGLVYLPAGDGKEILAYGEGRELGESNCLGHRVMDCPPKSPEDSLTSCKLFSDAAPVVMPSEVSVSLCPLAAAQPESVLAGPPCSGRGDSSLAAGGGLEQEALEAAPEEAILTLALFPWHLTGLRTPSFRGGCRDPGSIITPAGSGREIYIPGREQP